MVSAALRAQVRQLLSDLPDAAFDADCILCDLCGLTRQQLLFGCEIPEEQAQQCLQMASRRAAGVPLQYLLGQWEFYGLTFTVGEGVLIPRPDTEILVEQALARCPEDALVVDLCAGSGCVAAAVGANRVDAAVAAVENSPDALPFLQKNLQRNCARAQVVQADVLSSETVQRFGGVDILTCNPPYLTAAELRHLQREVEYEPAAALYGGEDGLAYYRALPTLWMPALRPGGWLLLEVGAGQADEVRELLRQAGYTAVAAADDLAGIPRVVCGRKPLEGAVQCPCKRRCPRHGRCDDCLAHHAKLPRLGKPICRRQKKGK